MRGRLLLLFVLLGTLVPGLTQARGADAPLVAIIDSGIEASHPQFEANQVTAWKDWVNGRSERYDDLGHGTAVASRAAGATFGAFPGARLAVAKVLSKDNIAYADDVDAAIRWAADLGAATINVSLWSEIPDPYGWRVTSQAVHYARSKGSLVVWIAGNGGDIEVQGRRSVPTPVPATTLWGSSSPEALVVGSAAADGSVDGYSQWVPELVARGSGVDVAWRGGTVGRGSGTSFAAPWVAGAAARLIAEGAPRDVNWLKWVLNHAAVDSSASYLREGYGWLNDSSVEAALAVARGEARVPLRDGRDDDHDRAMLVASVETGQEPAGTKRP